jgi:uncharacterized protein (TIGR02996 family)
VDLLERIAESPDDLELRRVYADELVERGDSRGELMQLQCVAQKTPAQRLRERQLLREHVPRWTEPFARLGVLDVRFRLGLPERVRVPLHAFVKHGAGIFALAPTLRSARIIDVTAAAAPQLAACEHLARLEDLKAGARSQTPMRGAGAEALVASPHLGKLRRLSLARNWIGTNAARAIAGADTLPSLRSVDLSLNDAVGARGASALVGAARLREVTLRWCGIDAALDVGASRLESLDLSENALGDDGVRRLLGIRSLRRLRLENVGASDDGLRALAELPLEELAIDDRRRASPPDVVAAILAIPTLRRLSINADLGRLADRGLLEKIEVLDQMSVSYERGALERLLPGMPRLRELGVSWDPADAQALLAHPTLRVLRGVERDNVPPAVVQALEDKLELRSYLADEEQP